MSRYRNLGRKRSLASYLDVNGSVASMADDSSVNTRREDEKSVTFSFICRNIAILQVWGPPEMYTNSKTSLEDTATVFRSFQTFWFSNRR